MGKIMKGGISYGGGTSLASIAPIETSSMASQAYAVGDQFIISETLYTCTVAISAGDTITVGTNCAASDTLVEQIGDKQDTLTFDTVPTSGSTNPVTSGGLYNQCITDTTEPTQSVGQIWICDYS